MKSALMRFGGVLLLLATFATTTIAAESYAVFKSTDRGRSWSRSDAGMPGQSRINVFGSVEAVLFAGTDSGVFISRDEARSWRPASGAAMTSGRIISLATHRNTVWAGTDGSGLMMSEDRGESWVRNALFPSRKVRCLIVHGKTLYAGTDSDGVFVFDAEEQVWSRRQEGLPPHAQVFALSVADGGLFAGLYSQGLFVWSERERRWTRSGPVSPLALVTSRRTLIAGHNPGGLYWSADFGASWSGGILSTVDAVPSPLADSFEKFPDGAPVWEMTADDDVALAGVSQGVYLSRDHGRTWVRAQEGLPAKGPGVAFLVNRAIMLAGISIVNPEGKP